MKSIEIVSTCWSKDMPQYARMLTAQLSSLVLWPPKAKVTMTVIHCMEDDETQRSVDSFRGKIPDLRTIWLEPERLFRRAIGRNIAFKTSVADICWACDCDCLWSEGCLDALAETEFTGLAFPSIVMFHRSHQLGDEDIGRITPGELFKIDVSRFTPGRVKFASGGYMIVDGATAKKGYLDGSRYTRPVDPANGFCDPREDIRYRKQFGKSTAISIPNVMRFRHSASPWQAAEKRLAQTEGKGV